MVMCTNFPSGCVDIPIVLLYLLGCEYNTVLDLRLLYYQEGKLERVCGPTYICYINGKVLIFCIHYNKNLGKDMI